MNPEGAESVGLSPTFGEDASRPESWKERLGVEGAGIHRSAQNDNFLRRNQTPPEVTPALLARRLHSFRNHLARRRLARAALRGGLAKPDQLDEGLDIIGEALADVAAAATTKPKKS